MPKLTQEIIEAAITGFEARKKSIDGQIAELRAMIETPTAPAPSSAPAKRGRTKRKVSPKALKRMREGQRRRRAAEKGETPTPVAAEKPKRKLSAAGRKAIVAALKNRWAAKRSAAA
jgi:hypothetical protein